MTSQTPTTDDRGDASFRSAVLWSYAMDGARVLMTVVVTLVLARTLGPEIYGTAAFALVFVLLVRLVVQNGMVAAIIQREDLDEAHLQAAFKMVMVGALLLAGLTVLTAPLWAELTSDDQLTDVLRVLAIMVVVGGLIVVPEGIQRRRLNFRALAGRTTIAVFVGSVVALIAAAAGAGIWALVLQQLVTETIALILLWIITPWTPSLSFDRAAARDLLGFWSGTVLASVGNYLRWQADILLVGVFFPQTSVGLYRFAQRMPDQWSELSVRALQSASLPELARHQGDRRRFGQRVLTVVRLSAVVGIPALGLLAALSGQLVELVDASQWGDADLAIKILCIATAMKALTLFSAPVLQAMGRTYALAALTWFHAALAITAFAAIGGWLGDPATAIVDQVTGAAWSRTALMAFAVLVDSIVVARLASLPVTAIIRVAVPSMIAALVAFAVAATVAGFIDDLPALVVIAVAGSIGAVGLGVTLLLLEPLVRDNVKRVPVLGPRLARLVSRTDRPMET